MCPKSVGNGCVCSSTWEWENFLVGIAKTVEVMVVGVIDRGIGDSLILGFL